MVINVNVFTNVRLAVLALMTKAYLMVFKKHSKYFVHILTSCLLLVLVPFLYSDIQIV